MPRKQAAKSASGDDCKVGRNSVAYTQKFLICVVCNRSFSPIDVTLALFDIKLNVCRACIQDPRSCFGSYDPSNPVCKKFCEVTKTLCTLETRKVDPRILSDEHRTAVMQAQRRERKGTAPAPFQAGSFMADVWNMCIAGTTTWQLQKFCYERDFSFKRAMMQLRAGGRYQFRWTLHEGEDIITLEVR